ncbi:hypothetical protein HYH03_005813 [Edaphochlamys debaryana]|uniref:Uncharacterized protein n=1 Tax=Edaphochlamys debaryana TaxID=47281 RepID=A0A835Y4Z2_9CHLO|nr:hypothetical protein HYH03_005813 [Edaphochlamys debaryana]|eukprot:KAG2496215.1 hypothetical protein HYH03_005813 [Edaphochlamys debaryana]
MTLGKTMIMHPDLPIYNLAVEDMHPHALPSVVSLDGTQGWGIGVYHHPDWFSAACFPACRSQFAQRDIQDLTHSEVFVLGGARALAYARDRLLPPQPTSVLGAIGDSTGQQRTPSKVVGALYILTDPFRTETGNVLGGYVPAAAVIYCQSDGEILGVRTFAMPLEDAELVGLQLVALDHGFPCSLASMTAMELVRGTDAAQETHAEDAAAFRRGEAIASIGGPFTLIRGLKSYPAPGEEDAEKSVADGHGSTAPSGSGAAGISTSGPE